MRLPPFDPTDDGLDIHASVNIDKCPYGVPGDRLWVRETWAPVSTFDPSPETGALYRADPIYDGMSQSDFGFRWKPSIHMPRWASRITLEVVSVRVERLQEISEADAKAEGVDEMCVLPGDVGSFVQPFAYQWELINGPGAWARNDWVWVVEFKRVEVAT